MADARHVRSFYLYQATASVVFFQPIFFVYYQDVVGLSLATVLAIASYNVALRAVLEVPAGALADRWSRRGCLVASAAGIATAAALLVLVPSATAVVLAETVLASAHALRSGADSALLYDAMRARGQVAEYAAVESRARAVGSLSSGVTALVGGVLADLHLAWPYLATVAAAIVGAGAALRLRDAPHDPLAQPDGAGLGRAALQAMRSPAIAWSMSLAVMAVVASHVYYYLQQPYLRLIDAPLWAFGVVFAATKMVTALVAVRAHRVDARFGPGGTAAVMACVPVLGLGGMAALTTGLGAGLVLTRGILDGLWEPLVNVYLNRLVPSRLRATLLSVQNLAARLALAATVALLAWCTSQIGVRGTLAGAAAVTLVVGVTLYRTARVADPEGALAEAKACDT